MKKSEEKEKQSLSIHQKIRKASFVQIKSRNVDSFKYKLIHKLSSKLPPCKRFINSILQKPRLWTSKLDWIRIRNDGIEWIIDAIIEGLTANFATHFLLGVQFNPMTVLAHGIIIKQGLSIYWRLRRDGTNNKLPKKDE